MKLRLFIPFILATACMQLVAQETPVQETAVEQTPAKDVPAQDAPPSEPKRDFRYSLGLIDDATLYSNLQVPIPKVLNQILVEPTFTLRYDQRWTFASSVAGLADTYTDTYTQLRVKEAYAGLSAGDFDFMAGRRIVRWGTGYAFTAIGVLDPPRIPTNPTDRLNLNEGRDMVKADCVHGPNAFTLAWSTAALAPASANLHDTTAFRYNVLVHGFDTSLIAGDDRGGDAFGGLTFTRVLGEAWEIHGEAAWREHEAVLIGTKYTTTSGITFLGEFYTPPIIPYYRDVTLYPLIGRQHYAFLTAYKNRLRELPGWKQWDLSAAAVANLNDRSFTAIFDANRRFGNHFSSYLHMEIPVGSPKSEYGATPYSAATSVGVRFQL
ncbi:MAG: hypothetical protein ABR923_01795 [Terracidiphilus sp.]